MNALWIMGDEEGAWRASEELLKAAGGRPGRAPEEMFQNADTLNWNLPAWRASLVADVDSHCWSWARRSKLAVGPVIADVDVVCTITTSWRNLRSKPPKKERATIQLSGLLVHS